MEYSAHSGRSPLDNCRGYTLVELVVVLVIIGIIATVAMKSLTAANETVRIEETKRELTQIAHAITGDPNLVSGGVRTDYGFVGDNGRLPSSLNDLLTAPPGYSNWQGPYISDEFTSGSPGTEYKNDAWGKPYSFTGGLTVASTGGSIPLTRTLANSADDLLRNNASFTFTDLDFTPPGNDYRDSIRFIVFYPVNGSITSRTGFPAADGFVSFDSIPIGLHTLRVVYLPDNDTLTRMVSVTPGQDYYSDIQYSADLWTAAGTGGGGGGTSGSEILRPNGSGASSQLTDSPTSGSNWEKVDEAASDGNASCVVGNSSTWRRDSYALPIHSTGSGTIDRVVVHILCRGQGGTGQLARTSLRVGGAYFDGIAVNLDPVAAFSDFSTGYTTNPATSSPWTWSDVDSLEAGLSIQNEGRCTQLWVEVLYRN